MPAVDVKRRFHRGIYNFFKYYKPIADNWLLFNNAGIVPTLIAREKERNAEIIDKNLFEKITKTVR